MSTIQFEENPTDDRFVLVKFKNSKNFLNFITSNIPYNYRHWNPEYRCLEIHKKYLKLTTEVSEKMFAEVEISAKVRKDLLEILSQEPFRSSQNDFSEKSDGSYGSDKKSSLRASQFAKKIIFQKFFLTPDVPEYILDAVYKTMVFKCHPDVGGDSEVFLELTKSYEELKLLYKK